MPDDGTVPVRNRHASQDYCPALSPTVKPNPVHCQRIGVVVQKNYTYCKQSQCTCPWRVCWACAMQAVPLSSETKVKHPKVGLCEFHSVNGSEGKRSSSRHVSPPAKPITFPARKVAPPKVIKEPIVEKAEKPAAPTQSPAVEKPRVLRAVAPPKMVAPTVTEPDSVDTVPALMTVDQHRVDLIRTLRDKYQSVAPIKVPLAEIAPDPGQPRSYFDPEQMRGLAESIKTIGQQDPGLIVIAPQNNGIKYRLVDGERRYRACGMVGVPEYLAWVCEPAEVAVLFALSVVKNFNRAPHTAMETALAFKRLRDEFGFSQVVIAQLVGKPPGRVSYYLRLTALVPEVAEMTELSRADDRRLALTVAVDIAGLPADLQLSTAQKVINDGLSVPRACEYVRKLGRLHGAAPRVRVEKPSDVFAAMISRLERADDSLRFYYEGEPRLFAGALRTRSSEDRKRVRELLDRIGQIAKELSEAIPKD